MWCGAGAAASHSCSGYERSAEAVEGVGCHGNIIGTQRGRWLSFLRRKQGMAASGQQHMPLFVNHDPTSHPPPSLPSPFPPLPLPSRSLPVSQWDGLGCLVLLITVVGLMDHFSCNSCQSCEYAHSIAYSGPSISPMQSVVIRAPALLPADCPGLHPPPVLGYLQWHTL